ncbi:MAG: pilus assembly protein [Gemmatimonadales bacterium]|nr:pilus assembly protein [Gemmatimonadales bacterium]
MRQLQQSPRHRRGQALVEFALVMPLLLLFLVGIIEFGRGWNSHQVITDAAREAARKCVIADSKVTQDTVVNVAKSAMAAAGINTAPASVSVTGFARPNPTGLPCTVAIQLPYTFTFLGPMMSWTTGQRSITLTSSFSMRNE